MTTNKARKDKPELKTGDNKVLIKSANQFPVVGIGASAGGLTAFKKLLQAIPENSGMAYVLVQHLDPHHESFLPEILQKVTSIPVLEITDDMQVEPDHIYVIPSNKMMVATDGVLSLAPRPQKSKTERNLPIDLFFSSLAEVHQSHAIGVVLSGTASDGTQGLKAIKDHGGITFAQDEESAEYESMPGNAIKAGVVDFILPPEKIPQKLLEVINKVAVTDEELQNIPQQEEEVFRKILSLLRIRKGVDFTYYKQTTIRRRILRRMVVNKTDTTNAYLNFLKENTGEQDLLFQDLLIPVTTFFRDKKVFDNLCNNVFPQIIKNKVPGDVTRIWVAGCSTGQEVYSFAICFKEFLGASHERIQIFGTDLSEPAIIKARTGIYDKHEIESVSPERLQQFFTKVNGNYQVNKNIRDLCVFAHHNFLKDPPFGKMDCISCRNSLIYMEPYLQKKALITFHYALNPKGFLLLGKSETTGIVPDLFVASESRDGHRNDKLFIRKDVPARFMQVASSRSEQTLSRNTVSAKTEHIRTDFQKTADDILLNKYTPAGVVVNETMDIVLFKGSTSNFLEQTQGKPSHNLMVMAKHGLAFELRNILHKAKHDKTRVLKENIPVEINGSLRNISIEAIPLPNTADPYYLVLFHYNNADEINGSLTGIKKKQNGKTKKDEKDLRIQMLEQELSQAREDMRSITEEQDTSNIELQSANEELLSGSEELQSLNEELETSKEELQSTNEELTVLNHELINLNEQLTDARNYAESIVTTLYQPLLVLDKNLRVKTANKAFYKKFQVTEEETENVLIYDLGNRQWNIPLLRTLLEEILPKQTEINDFEVTHNFSSIGERTILLNALEITREKKEEKLILISIDDITEKKEIEKILINNTIRFRQLVKELPAAVYSCDAEGEITFHNDAAIRLWGRHPEAGKDKWDCSAKIYTMEGTALPLEKYPIVQAVKQGTPTINKELIIERPNGTRSFVLVNSQAELGLGNEITGAIKMLFDVTEQVLARKKIEESEHRYHNMIFSSPTLIAILKGEDMIIEIANDVMLEQWGKGKDVIGKSLLEALPELVEQGIGEILQEVYRTGTSYFAYERPIYYIRNGKKVISYYSFVYQVQRDLEDKIEGIAIIANEVTPQAIFNLKIKQSEAYFRQMADMMPQKVWTADAAGNYDYVNKCWFDYTGLEFDELKDWGWQQVVHPDDWEETKIKWEESIKTGENFEMEHRFINTEGIYKWHLSRGLAQKDENETIIMWIGTNTEMQHIKEEEQRKGDFIKMVSHELKTPVTSIKGYVQLSLTMLEEKKENQGGTLIKNSLTRIDKQVMKLTRLITEMLDLSRIEESKLVLRQDYFCINDLVTETVTDQLYSTAKNQVNVVHDITCHILGDKDRIEQVVINFLNNAIKYSSENSPVEIRIHSEKKKEVSVSISDQGIGIDVSEHEKIFERFYRVEGKNEQTYPGFGIGLFIAKSIIERHKGSITIKSEKGKGATFTFTLPVATESKQ